MNRGFMFSRLLRMYQSHSSKTPMEDFTTELLRGVLAANQELTDAFVQHFFNIQEVGFSIETQVSYPASKVDMVFSNKSTTIFIENKEEGIIKISFRSQGDFDVNQFARNHFNGGGHINAAGGKSFLSLEETVQQFIAILAKEKK